MIVYISALTNNRPCNQLRMSGAIAWLTETAKGIQKSIQILAQGRQKLWYRRIVRVFHGQELSNCFFSQTPCKNVAQLKLLFRMLRWPHSEYITEMILALNFLKSLPRDAVYMYLFPGHKYAIRHEGTLYNNSAPTHSNSSLILLSKIKCQ